MNIYSKYKNYNKILNLIHSLTPLLDDNGYATGYASLRVTAIRYKPRCARRIWENCRHIRLASDLCLWCLRRVGSVRSDRDRDLECIIIIIINEYVRQADVRKPVAWWSGEVIKCRNRKAFGWNVSACVLVKKTILG